MFDSEQPHQQVLLEINFEISQFTFRLFLQNSEFRKLFENFVDKEF